MDAARTFADGNGGNDFEVGPVDDSQVTGFFVGDKNLIIATGLAFDGSRRQAKGAEKNGGQ